MSEQQNTNSTLVQLSRKDFQTANDVRWCPACGDYAILAAVQKFLPTLGIAKENIAFISGIGCSSRFPYYLNTYGMHSIHGRAPAIASGLKLANPDLSVWIVTGDGDALSIGGNHILHILRRNMDVNILLFNNEIYGLTKGQYSPASEQGKITKSSPLGSLDHSANPALIALGAEASFYARVIDRDPKHMIEIFKRAHQHSGTSMIEIYQNCIVFNDGPFDALFDKKQKHLTTLHLEHGKAWLFDNDHQGIALNPETLQAEIVDLKKQPERLKDIIIHDESDPSGLLGTLLANMKAPHFPVPLGIFRAQKREVYNQQMQEQGDFAIEKLGQPDLKSLLFDAETWEVQ